MDRKQLETIARIKFPSSVYDIKNYTVTGMDQLLMVRFIIHADDIHLFINDSGFKDHLKKNFRPFVNDYGIGLDWWEIDKLKKVFGTVQYYEDGSCRSALIEDSNSETVNVYIVIQR